MCLGPPKRSTGGVGFCSVGFSLELEGGVGRWFLDFSNACFSGFLVNLPKLDFG